MCKSLSVFLFLAGLSQAQLSPCESYACDVSVVQSILDVNGLSQFSAGEVTQRDSVSGRVALLNLNRQGDLAGITTLPEAVGRIAHLQKLWLADQEIRILPESIGELTHLEDLILYGNALESLPDGTKNLARLQRLVLSGNPLKAFPSEASSLKELRYLSIGGRDVDSVPEAFWSLSSLTELSITNTSVSVLPGAIAQLSNLRTLTLSGNRLERLPAELAKLENLMFLLVDDNQISSLPEEIVTLDLYNFSLSNNGVCELSPRLEEWVDHRATTDWRNTQTCVVGVEPVKNKSGFSVEQLPDRLLLKVGAGFLMEANVYDALGKKASGKLRTTNKSAEWFIADWQPGTYYLQAVFEGGTMLRKVVVAH